LEYPDLNGGREWRGVRKNFYNKNIDGFYFLDGRAYKKVSNPRDGGTGLVRRGQPDGPPVPDSSLE